MFHNNPKIFAAGTIASDLNDTGGKSFVSAADNFMENFDLMNPENYPGEEWLPIVGYPDYDVSNYGRIRTWIKPGNRKHRVRRDAPVLKKLHIGKTGYHVVSLNGDTRKVNRLVAEAFIPNPNNYKITNHLDGRKTWNHVSNLEWQNHLGNLLHAFRTGLNDGVKPRCSEDQWYPEYFVVVQMDMDGNYIAEYETASEACRQVGPDTRKIRRVCNGERRSTGGFKWKYKEERKR